jgi:CheY-like chemotaxis protein
VSTHPIQILLVEDSQSDVELTIEAMRETAFPYELNVAFDGVEAMAYLRREGLYVFARRPDLLLLDLNLPRKDGKEVLAEMQSDTELQPMRMCSTLTSSEPTVTSPNR